MPRRRPSDRPPDWRSPLERSQTGWVTYRLTEDNVHRLALILHRPDVEAEMTAWWAEFSRLVEERQAKLAQLDWSRMTGYELVTFLEARTHVRLGWQNFLPIRYADVPSGVRTVLYVLGLVIVRGEDPIVALRATWYAAAGALAVEEIARRDRRHVGLAAATLAMVAARRQHDLPGGDLEPRAAVALDRLRPGVLRHVPDEVRAWIVREETSGQTLAREALHHTVDRKAFETVLSEWGRGDPWVALARALDGHLDIAPKKIANRLQDERRRRHLREGTERLLPEEDLQDIQFRVIEDDTQTTVTRFLFENPDLRKHLELLLSPLSTEEEARRRGVTVQTIRAWRRRAEAEIRRVLEQLS